MTRALKQWLARAALATGAVLSAATAAAWLALRTSLPQLDGVISTATGLANPVSIERDALGVVTVRAASRPDLAWGTGFAHAQDRFFQMDLARRLAAGELAEIFGAAALDHDRRARVFRFRALAAEVAARAPPAAQALLSAYARGVNAGLAVLRARPWEYLVLGSAPIRWREEDSVLVLYAMWWQLQHSAIERDVVREAVRAAAAQLPEAPAGTSNAFSFLYPHGTEWDAPLETGAPAAPSAQPLEPVPPPLPAHWNLRARRPGRRTDIEVLGGPLAAAGSNSFAVAGHLTASGAALVANDMHLGLAAPTVWYRMRLVLEARPLEGRAGAATTVGTGHGLDLNGVTLAGTPALVAGSNGRIAWSFTNTYGNWLETQRAPCRAPGYRETVEWLGVRGREERERLVVRDSSGGRLVDRGAQASAQRECHTVRWTALDPAATNFTLMELESVDSLAAALAVAQRSGMPHQNFIAGAAHGRIGWTIAGRIPQRARPAGSLMASRYLAPEEYPQVLDPPSGRLWTANSRPVDGEGEAALGGDEAMNGADYELGARARQIRDALMAQSRPIGPQDLLAVQLDDRAVFLDRWRTLLLGLLDPEATANSVSRRELRDVLRHWDGRAGVESTAYRLVREFRDRVERETWEMLLEDLRVELDDPRPPPQFEGALWQLANGRPMHLLASEYASWRDFLLDQVDEMLRHLQTECADLMRCRWGAARRVHIRHALSGALPLLDRLVDMPVLELPGDRDMPRVQIGAFGASERFAVAPGHEAEGYLHLAGGQSGHPLSPFYRAGFDAWARGEPLPFLPGPVQHRLRVQPQREPTPERGAPQASPRSLSEIRREAVSCRLFAAGCQPAALPKVHA